MKGSAIDFLVACRISAGRAGGGDEFPLSPYHACSAAEAGDHRGSPEVLPSAAMESTVASLTVFYHGGTGLINWPLEKFLFPMRSL